MIELRVFTNTEWTDIDVPSDSLLFDFQYADIRYEEFFSNGSYELTLPKTPNNERAFYGVRSAVGVLTVGGNIPLGKSVRVQVNENSEDGISVSVLSAEKSLFEKLDNIPLGVSNGSLGYITNPKTRTNLIANDPLYMSAIFFYPKFRKDSKGKEYMQPQRSNATATPVGLFSPLNVALSKGSVPCLNMNELIKRILAKGGYTADIGSDVDTYALIPRNKNAFSNLIDTIDIPKVETCSSQGFSYAGKHSNIVSGFVTVPTNIQTPDEQQQIFEFHKTEVIDNNPIDYYDRVRGQYYKFSMCTYYDSNGVYHGVDDVIMGNDHDFIQLIFDNNGVITVRNYDTEDSTSRLRYVMKVIFAYVKNESYWADSTDNQGRKIKVMTVVICNSYRLFFSDSTDVNKFINPIFIQNRIRETNNYYAMFFPNNLNGHLLQGCKVQIGLNIPTQAFVSFAVNSCITYNSVAKEFYHYESGTLNKYYGIGDFCGGLTYDVCGMLRERTASELVKAWLTATNSSIQVQGNTAIIRRANVYEYDGDPTAYTLGKVEKEEYMDTNIEETTFHTEETDTYFVGIVEEGSDDTVFDKEVEVNEYKYTDSLKIRGAYADSVEISFGSLVYPFAKATDVRDEKYFPFVPYKDGTIGNDVLVQLTINGKCSSIVRGTNNTYKYYANILTEGEKVYAKIRTATPQQLPQKRIYIEEKNQYYMVEKIAEYDPNTMVGVAECYLYRPQRPILEEPIMPII